MPKVVVLAQDKRLRGVFTQRQKAYEAVEDPAVPYHAFCKELREDGKSHLGNHVVAWLTELNEVVTV